MSDKFTELIEQTVHETIENQMLPILEKLREIITLKPVPEYMNYEEAASYLSCSKSYLYQLKSLNKIPFYDSEVGIRFNKKDLDKWMLKYRVMDNDEVKAQAGTR